MPLLWLWLCFVNVSNCWLSPSMKEILILEEILVGQFCIGLAIPCH
jgi:hypothetical protein